MRGVRVRRGSSNASFRCRSRGSRSGRGGGRGVRSSAWRRRRASRRAVGGPTPPANGPIAEGRVAGDTVRAAPVEMAGQGQGGEPDRRLVEVCRTNGLPAGPGEGQESRVVGNDRVEAREEDCRASLLAAAGFGLHPFHGVDHVDEAAARAAPDERPGEDCAILTRSRKPCPGSRGCRGSVGPCPTPGAFASAMEISRSSWSRRTRGLSDRSLLTMRVTRRLATARRPRPR